MIYGVTSTDQRFRKLAFQQGLNILVADRHEQATDTDTRNGVGKSSFVTLLHFLLGGNAGKSSIFVGDALADSVFTLDLDVGPTRRSVARSGRTPAEFIVSRDSFEPADQLIPDDSPSDTLKAGDWQTVLRKTWFGLDGPTGPSCRSLLTYFIRRVEDGGFQDPFKNNYQQTPSDYQVAISFLLDLDWHIAESWEEVRKRDKNIQLLSVALKEGRLGSYTTGSVAKLRTEVTLAENRANALRANIEGFCVVDAFVELEREANDLSTTIRQLADDNSIDMALTDQLKLTYETESPPSADDLNSVYETAGIQLGELVRRRFDEVAEFHESIIQNRIHHLQVEVNSAEERIRDRSTQQRLLDSRRADLLRILRSGGALSELTGLQEELTKAQANLEDLRNSYRIADEIASGKAGVKRARQSLLVELQEDQRERDSQLRMLIGRFEDFSSRLYDERVGSLEIGSSENGPTFSISIDAGKSKGINNMQVFCFDLLIAQLCAERGIGPGFLVHDSHLFDGVDERQIGRGLALADEIATLHGFQYIVTMNSDDLPSSLPDGFSLDEHIMELRLTDSVKEGGLFGFRF